MFEAKKEQSLYIVNCEKEKCFPRVNNENAVMWDERFGHLNFQNLKQLAQN